MLRSALGQVPLFAEFCRTDLGALTCLRGLSGTPSVSFPARRAEAWAALLPAVEATAGPRRMGHPRTSQLRAGERRPRREAALLSY
jgi:hypothetical protein